MVRVTATMPVSSQGYGYVTLTPNDETGFLALTVSRIESSDFL